MKSRLIFSFLFFIAPAFVFAEQKSIPINLSLFNESTAIPFTRFFTTPVHPGIQVGTEFNYKRTEHSRLFQTINASYFYHNYLSQGMAINTEFGYEYRMKSGLAFKSLLGIGYMHTFATTEEFVFSNGQYIKQTDKGNARFYPSLSFDVGYYLRKLEKNSPQLFIRYQSWVEYPY